jgi:hypothetical protein
VEHVNNEIKSLYTFELGKGKICIVKNTGKYVYYNKKTELWESLKLEEGAASEKNKKTRKRGL